MKAVPTTVTPSATGRGARLSTGQVVAFTIVTSWAVIVAATVVEGDAVRAAASPPRFITAFTPDVWPLTVIPHAAAADDSAAAAVAATPVATTFAGLAFDICKTPPLATMRAWQASPYRAVGVYISGKARACKRQKNLTPQWVAEVSAAGWRLIPIDVSEQAPCGRFSTSRYAMDPTRAREQGATAARESVAAAAALGILPGSALYSDIEHYGRHADTRCVTAVADFLDGWTKELHGHDYLADMYSSAGSGIAHAATRQTSAVRARLDAVWMAQWEWNQNLVDWPGVDDAQWVGRRIKQFRGGHWESYGGVPLRIDSNVLDAPVATVAPGVLDSALR